MLPTYKYVFETQKLFLCLAHPTSSSLDIISNLVLKKNINLPHTIIFDLINRKFESLNDLYKSIDKKFLKSPVKMKN